MKAPREIKQWFNRLRRKWGKRNGVISCGVTDNSTMERKLSNSIKSRSRATFKKATTHD